jgi:hypothetical protein
MKRKLTVTVSVTMVALASLVTTPHAQSARPGQTVSMLAADDASVKGNGTVGQLPKWVGGSNPTRDVGDSIVSETSSGQIGIGTQAPASKLTVAGTIESTLGGFKFPDSTIQTTAGLAAVVHDVTLAGTGSAASPLGVAPGGIGAAQLASNAVTAAAIAPGNVVKGLNGLTDNVTLAAGNGVTLTPAGNTLTIAADADANVDVFQAVAGFNLRDDVSEAETTIDVPSGKRLVIEYVNVDVFLFNASTTMRVLLFSTVKGVTARYQFPVEFNGDNAAGSLPVKIYADGDIKLRVDRLSGGQSLVAVNVSGRLVDLP